MALDVTVAGATSDSYVTLDEMQTYLDSRRVTREAWDGNIDHEAMLRTACMMIDQFDFIGDRATTTQALQWPRETNDSYDLAHTEFPYADNVIPTPIKRAQMEIAYWLADTGGTSSEAVSELQIGSSVRAKFVTSEGSSSSGGVDSSGIPLEAARQLKGIRLHPVLI